MKNRKLLCSLLCFVMVLQLLIPFVFAEQISENNPQTDSPAITQASQSVTDSVYGQGNTIVNPNEPPTDEEAYKYGSRILLLK